MTKDLKLAFIKPTAAVLASPRKFKPYGKCGMEMSDYIPNIARAPTTSAWCGRCTPKPSTITPASCCSSRGTMQFGRPTLGAWVPYTGSGSESENLPGIRRAQLRRRHQRRSFQFIERLSALHLSGRDVPELGRSDPVPLESARRRARDASEPTSTPSAISMRSTTPRRATRRSRPE